MAPTTLIVCLLFIYCYLSTVIYLFGYIDLVCLQRILFDQGDKRSKYRELFGYCSLLNRKKSAVRYICVSFRRQKMNMTKQELLDDLMPVFVQILDDEDVVIGFSTTARDVDNWDSLNHLQLIVAIEKKYNVRFNSAEIDKFKTVGDILDTVLQKLN